MILIQDGTRFCDEKCYLAKGEGCKCVCGGKNHGVGQKKAMENAIEILENSLDEEAKEKLKEVVARFEKTFGIRNELVG